MNVLQRLLDTKKQRLDQAKSRMPRRELQAQIDEVEPPRDFITAVSGQRAIRLVAELKKASPSRGLIRPDFDPVTIARIYEEHGANAVSCLTEEDYFQGHLSFLPLVHNAVKLPVLRKDFIFDAYQIYESRVNNADAVLLIAAALETNQAQDYLHLAQELGMAVLFEVHNEADLEQALAIEAPIVGINNRDLVTMEIDFETTFRLKAQIPPGIIVVGESGISTRAEVVRLNAANIDAMLVGTVLMKSKDVGAKTRELLGTA